MGFAEQAFAGYQVLNGSPNHGPHQVRFEIRLKFTVLNAFLQHLSGISGRPLDNFIGLGFQKIAIPL